MRKNTGAESERARDLFLALTVSDLFMERIETNSEWCLFDADECPGLDDSYGDKYNKLYLKYEEEGKYRKKIQARKKGLIFLRLPKMSLNVSETGFQNNSLEQKSVLASVDAFVSSELNLKTSEGDLVSLSFAGEQSLSESSTQKRNQENVAIQEFSSVARAATAYSLTVQGDLNAEELAAINKLAEEIAPLAREFFANGELNLVGSANVLANNLGVLQEVELALERMVMATFAASNVKPLPEDGGDITNIEALPTQAPELEIDGVRDFPALVKATLDAVFESEAGQVPEQDSILKSLNDLLSFIRDRLDQFFNPPTDLATLPVESAAGADGVANIDAPVLEGSEPPNQLEQ